MYPKFDRSVDREKFAAWLKNELAIRDWSQAAFAREAGVSKTQVARYLTGECMPLDLTIPEIARALEIPGNEMYGIVGLELPNWDDAPEDLQFLRTYDRLSAENQQII